MVTASRWLDVWKAGVGVALLCLAVGAAAAADPPRGAAPGDIQMHLSVRPMCGLHAPGEPLVITVQLENLGNETVYALDPNRLVLEVLDARGERVHYDCPPDTQDDADEVHSMLQIDAGKRWFPSVLSLETPVCLSNPGTYTVHVALPDWGRPHHATSPTAPLPVLAEASAEYVVRPAEPGDVDAIVQHLVWYANRFGFGLGGNGDEPFWPEVWRDRETRDSIRDHAGGILAALRLEAAVPYLIQIAHTDREPWAFEGIRMVGTLVDHRDGVAVMSRSLGEQVAELPLSGLLAAERRNGHTRLFTLADGKLTAWEITTPAPGAPGATASRAAGQ